MHARKLIRFQTPIAGRGVNGLKRAGALSIQIAFCVEEGFAVEVIAEKIAAMAARRRRLEVLWKRQHQLQTIAPHAEFASPESVLKNHGQTEVSFSAAKVGFSLRADLP